MNRITKLALASTFAFGLALPALAETTPAQTTPAQTTPVQTTLAQTAPGATAPAVTDSGIKAASPDAAPAPKHTKIHNNHIRHTTKIKTPATVKS